MQHAKFIRTQRTLSLKTMNAQENWLEDPIVPHILSRHVNTFVHIKSQSQNVIKIKNSLKCEMPPLSLRNICMKG